MNGQGGGRRATNREEIVLFDDVVKSQTTQMVSTFDYDGIMGCNEL